ncbi:hypothetical protein MKW98_028956 [Papaver atlanticum]|uniref:PGG domain-containing protein n=1 Tax=Papaver atlanticum TaxID=357466 RepID=A0AAD4TLG1_9MAGN|nr:hypothetical protein MKW98_028956 [Papaver atlanticum]
MCGHVKFSLELMRRNNLLTRLEDSHGFTPLHLASARTSSLIVEKLLDGNNQDICIFQDQDGRTPVHLAAIEGRVKTIKLLLEKNPEAIHTRNGQHETILHLCVQHNCLKALKLLMNHLSSACADPISGNSTYAHGNTILHLAAERKQMEYLMESKDFKIHTNALNNDSLKARDMLTQSERYALEIGCYKKEEKTSKEWMIESLNALLVVATLIAGIAFQAVMNPPGGVFQEDSTIKATDNPVIFTYYLGSVANSYESNHFDKYLKRQPEDTTQSQNRAKTNTNFVRALLKELDNESYSARVSFLKSRSPGIVLEHENWNKIIFKYKPRFSPYIIRYAGIPTLAYRNPMLYKIYRVSNAVAFLSIKHNTRYLVGMMIVSTLGWFISYIVVFISMSPPFYSYQNEFMLAVAVSVPILSLSVCVYTLYSWYLKSRKEVLFDQFRKEEIGGIGSKKYMVKTFLRSIPVYCFFIIGILSSSVIYIYAVIKQ